MGGPQRSPGEGVAVSGLGGLGLSQRRAGRGDRAPRCVCALETGAVNNSPVQGSLSAVLSHMVVERKTAELDYSVLFRSLFAGWHLHPIRAFDFQPYPNHDYGPDLHGKRILDIESFDNGAHSTFYIRLEDVVAGLTAVEQKLRHK